MSITAQCGDCLKRYNVDDALAGRKVRCKACGGVVRVPGGEAATTTKTTPRPARAAAAAPTAPRHKPAPRPTPPPAPAADPDDPFGNLDALMSLEQEGTIEDGPRTAAPPPPPPRDKATRRGPVAPITTDAPPPIGHRADAYVSVPGEATIDRFVPLVTIGAFVLALLSPLGLMIYHGFNPPPGMTTNWGKFPAALGNFLKVAGLIALALAIVPSALLLLGVALASRVMKFRLPPSAFKRCLAVVCTPVAIYVGAVGLATANGQPNPWSVGAWWWPFLAVVWLAALWSMFRLRPAPFGVTLGFGFVTCVVIPWLLLLLVGLIVGETIVGNPFRGGPPVRGPRGRIVETPGAPRAGRNQAETALLKINQGIAEYARAHNGRPPVSVFELEGVAGLTKGDLQPANGSLYFLDAFGPPYPAPPRFILAYDPTVRDGRRSVLFGDGHVETVEISRWGDVVRESMRAQAEALRAR